MDRKFSLKPECAHNAGFVFVTTMMMTSTLALMVLALMQTVHLYAKASAHLVIKRQNFHQLEQAFYGLIAQLEDYGSSNCLLDGIAPNASYSLFKSNQGCVFKFRGRSYLYWIQDVGDYPCMQLIVNQKLMGTHHWLISMKDASQGVLQMRVAMPSLKQPCKTSIQSTISHTILSWRHVKL